MAIEEPVYSPGESPVSRKLVDLIERNAEELTRTYLDEVIRDPRMPTYRTFDRGEVTVRAHRVFSQLGRWLSNEFSREQARSYWMALGRQRRRENFPFSEIVLSLCHIRRTLWDKVQAEGLLDTALDLYTAMDLHHRVVLFFDRAVYFAALGYEEE